MTRPLFDSDRLAVAARSLSDGVGAMSWPRFWLIAFLLLCLFGALGDALGLESLGSLGAPIVISLIIIKALAKSRLGAHAAARDAQSETREWKSRLDAHFLFNAMAAIEHLIEFDPPSALPAQRALATYLRSGLSEPERSSTRSQAAACEAYLLIQKIRMGDRLQSRCEWLCDAPMPGRVAIAALERAVSACVEPSIQGGSVELSCKEEQGVLIWEMGYPDLCPLAIDFEPLRQEWLSQAPDAQWSHSSLAGRSKLRLGWQPALGARSLPQAP